MWPEVTVWFHDFAHLFHHVQFMPESLPQWPVIILTGYCFSHIRCCLQCMVRVKRNDTCLWKPLPLFCHFADIHVYKRNSGRRKCSSRRSVSEAAPRFGNLRTQCPLEQAFRFVAQLHYRCTFRKTFQLSASFFFWCLLYVRELVYLSFLIWLHSFCWSSVITKSGNEPLALPGMLCQIGELLWRQQLTQAWTSVHSFFYRMQLRIVSVWRVWEIT